MDLELLKEETLAMAMLLRRACLLRSVIVLRNLRHLSYLPCHSPFGACGQSVAPLSNWGRSLDSGYGIEFRRGFAKGRKPKDDNETVEVVPDIGPTVKATALSQMEAAMVALSRELSKLRTGRASPGMLDHIIVQSDGVKMPLSRVAVVSVIDAKTLCVTPYDPNSLKELEHALVTSPLGLNPRQDGQRLVAPIPPLTKEHVQAMCKLVTKAAEDVKQSIRRARQKALDSIKKAASSIPKDDKKRLEKEVEDMTKKYVKSADDMCKAKEKEIMAG